MSLISAIQVPQSISNAIKKASRATGADFSYLLKTAERESSFNEGAKAKTSSAAGLFQFIESTWLRTVKEVGNKFGLDKYTPHIFKTRSGRHYVPNQKLRQEILQLRHNPEVSATMAGAFTQKNSEFITLQLGRKPSQGELYIAHFLGPKGASDLIDKADRRPNARADRLFPRAARANKSIFYSRGRARSVSQVYKVLVREHSQLQETAIARAGNSQKTPAVALQWKTVTTPAPQAVHLAEAQPVRPVVPPRADKLAGEPVTFFSYPPRNANNSAHPLVRKVSIFPPMPVPLDGFSGVEAAIIPNPAYAAKPSPATGLAGQTNSPVKTPAKVAALTHTGLKIKPQTMTDVTPGRLGLWTTIVRPPSSESVVATASLAPAENKTAPPERLENKPIERKRTVRSAGLIEQSHKRNAARPRVQTASVIRRSNDDFWMQMSLDGN